MEGTPLSQRALENYRDRADRFLAELEEAEYLHFAGIKPELGLEAIYERFSDLTSLEQARAIGAGAASDSHLIELWRFACEGYLGALTRAASERLAALESGLEATINGERIPFRMLRPEIANSDQRARREQLERARTELVASELCPVQIGQRALLRESVRDLGCESAVDLYRRFGFPLDELVAECRSLLSETEDLYERSLEHLLKARPGIGLDEVARWDTPRLFRASHWDAGFPGAQMLPALERTLTDLGIDLRSQKNVELDVESRPNKSPRAFCSLIEIPSRIVLVIKPIGGSDDWRALLHEAGHTEHYANTSAGLSFEHRRLGDNAVTEGWAFLLEGLMATPEWLERQLDRPSATAFCWEGAVQTLYYARRYCAKLLYELELHDTTEPALMASRYVELLRNATLVEPSATDYLSDLDEGFYCTSYLRAWAFEARVRAFLRDRFGSHWFEREQAGALLRELWSEGQRLSADEILHELDGSHVELASLVAQVREILD